MASDTQYTQLFSAPDGPKHSWLEAREGSTSKAVGRRHRPAAMVPTPLIKHQKVSGGNREAKNRSDPSGVVVGRSLEFGCGRFWSLWSMRGAQLANCFNILTQCLTVNVTTPET